MMLLTRAVVAILCIVSVASCAAERAEPSSPSSAGTPTASATETAAVASASEAAEGESIDVGGRTLCIECQGFGSPTVILEAGMTGDHRTWERVQPEIAQSTRVCAYDRANIAPSDPAPGPRTAADSVDDLQALLDAAEIKRPIILVGFSMGGIISQLYAATYPEEIAGLVLVESNHPDEWEQFTRHLTPGQIEADQAFSLDNPEEFDPYASFEETQAAGPLPEVPLVVVTAPNATGEWPPDWDAELFDRLRAEQQADLASGTPGGVQVLAERSGHHVPSEQPQVIIDAVQTVLESVR